jgi:4-amino-4-deoxy-L-arabinose transferase-like glycosyltransferase
MPPIAPPTNVFPFSRWERILSTVLIAAFVIVGVNNIGNDAFEGQDYGFHVLSTFRLLHDPSAWFAQDITHRPLIYWIAINGFHLTDARAPFAFASGVFLLLNTGALWLVHDSTRRFIASPVLRISALALIAFWPVTLITTVVFAADAMAPPFFALLCWSLLRWYESAANKNGRASESCRSGFMPRTDRSIEASRHNAAPTVSVRSVSLPLDRSTAFAALAGVALVLGNFAKFTFILLPAGVFVLAFIAWHRGAVRARQVLTLVALAALAPTAAGVWLHQKAAEAIGKNRDHHRFNWKGTGEMRWGSLLLPKWTDHRIFAAPGYWDPEIINGKEYLPLLRENDYSYPALLHLGIFTDVLDFSNGGSQRGVRPRPQPQKTFSQWSVRLGVVFTEFRSSFSRREPFGL